MNMLVLLHIQTASSYLSIPQIRVVQAIIKHPDSPSSIRQKAKQILCKSYLPWAYKQGHNFIRQHSDKVDRIVKPHSLITYAMIGYLKGIENYNGLVPFHLYAKYYIQGSMYRGLTDLTPLKPYKHGEYYEYRDRMKKGTADPNWRSNRLVPYENYWTFDKISVYGQESIRQIENRSYIEQICAIIDQMDAPLRRMFYLRYDYTTLMVKTPIDDICQLMGFSHETYRKRMNRIIKQLREQVTDYEVNE